MKTRSCLFCNTVLDIEEDTRGTPKTFEYPGDPPGFLASCPRCDATLELPDGDDGYGSCHYSDSGDSALFWTATGKSFVELAKRLTNAWDHVLIPDIQGILPDLIDLVLTAEATQKREAKSERLAAQCRRAV